MRSLILVLAVLLSTSAPAAALRIIYLPLPPVARAVVVDVVCVGTVTAVETKPVQALPYPAAAVKVGYTVAVVKVADGIAGLKGATHIRVGFVPAVPIPDRAIRRPVTREFKGGERAGLFLVKHPTADFYVMPERCPPLDPAGADFTRQIDQMKAAVKAVADPAAALKAPAATDRAFAARVLVAKYRTGSLTGGEVEQAPVPAGESQLLLDVLGEMDWAKAEPTLAGPAALFQRLGATAADGWTPPVLPGDEYGPAMKAAFDAWRAGPGAKFVVKKYVPKKSAAK